jgi:hypothetical protein
MDNLSGKIKPVVAAPARIVIEQNAQGQLTISHNLKPAYLIGVLSTFINITAGQLAAADSLIIDPNKSKITVEETPPSDPPKEQAN